VYGAKIFADNGSRVEAGHRLVEWDPYSTPILTEIGGKVAFGDIIESVTFRKKWTRRPFLPTRSSLTTPATCVRVCR
jgi:DNA-directed RNA polymerase subunit beta'